LQIYYGRTIPLSSWSDEGFDMVYDSLLKR
jgi:hypothetical protein